MLRNHIFHRHIALGHCRCEHKRTGFDLIGNHGILCAMQMGNTLDTDHIRTGTLDIGSHAVQEVRQIHHMRFLGRVLDNRGAFRHYRSHHDIDGSADTDHIHINMAAAQMLRLCLDQAMLDLHVRAQSTEALNMLVNGTAADITSTGKCHFRMLVFT